MTENDQSRWRADVADIVLYSRSRPLLILESWHEDDGSDVHMFIAGDGDDDWLDSGHLGTLVSIGVKVL